MIKCIIAALILRLIFSIFAELIGIPSELGRGNTITLSDEEIKSKLVDFVIIAPIIETLLTQQLIYEALKRYLNISFVLLISAAIFGAIHFLHGLQFMVEAFSTGLVLSYTYIAWRPESKSQAFWMTVALHALLNGIAVTVGFCFND
ncbi:CPBP family intramembrane glutamic endopeptidase [Amantichitinum ursilacus]|nr:CPBP family intramembrane glutamic endopeptidase [Amantichitinum ursilacus]